MIYFGRSSKDSPLFRYEMADESYFFRVQTMLLYNRMSNEMFYHFFFAMMCSMIEIVALQTVWQSIWIPADFSKWYHATEEDVTKFYPEGMPVPVDYDTIFKDYDNTRIDGVHVVVVVPLIFCCISVVVGTRRAQQRLVERAGAVARQLIEPGDRVVVGDIESGLVHAVAHDDVVDQRHPLAPVVERRQLADDGQDSIGMASIVVGDVGQALDLAHDVVAEVADQTAVQRR